METILLKIKLPCSADRLEHALLKAAHSGHWHDAQVKMDADNHLVISYPETAK